MYIVYIYIENLIIASSFDIIILQNKVLQIDGMIMMAPMEMMIMMAKMALYFFFLFMEASSCSDLESCLAIVETWGEAVVGHELQGSSEDDDKDEQGEHLLLLLLQLGLQLRLGGLPCFQSCLLLLTFSLKPGFDNVISDSDFLMYLSSLNICCIFAILLACCLYLYLYNVPLYLRLQRGPVGGVLPHDDPLLLLQQSVLALQGSSWKSG